MKTSIAGIYRRTRTTIYNVVAAISVVSAAGSIVLMFVVISDVGSRTVGRGSLPGMLEASEALLVIITFLGLAQAERVGAHVRTTLLTDRLSPVARRYTRASAYVLYLGIAIWWAIASVGRAIESAGRGEFRAGLMQFPIYPARIVIAVGVIALVFVVILRLVDIILGDEEETYEDSPLVG